MSSHVDCYRCHKAIDTYLSLRNRVHMHFCFDCIHEILNACFGGTITQLHAAGVAMREAQDAWFDGGSLHEADASEAVFDAQLEAAGKLLKEEP